MFFKEREAASPLIAGTALVQGQEPPAALRILTVIVAQEEKTPESCSLTFTCKLWAPGLESLGSLHAAPCCAGQGQAALLRLGFLVTACAWST